MSFTAPRGRLVRICADYQVGFVSDIEGDLDHLERFLDISHVVTRVPATPALYGVGAVPLNTSAGVSTATQSAALPQSRADDRDNSDVSQSQPLPQLQSRSPQCESEQAESWEACAVATAVARGRLQLQGRFPAPVYYGATAAAGSPLPPYPVPLTTLPWPPASCSSSAASADSSGDDNEVVAAEALAEAAWPWLRAFVCDPCPIVAPVPWELALVSNSSSSPNLSSSDSSDLSASTRNSSGAPRSFFVFGGDAFDKGDDVTTASIITTLKRRFPRRVGLILGNRDTNKMKLASELAAGEVGAIDVMPLLHAQQQQQQQQLQHGSHGHQHQHHSPQHAHGDKHHHSTSGGSVPAPPVRTDGDGGHGHRHGHGQSHEQGAIPSLAALHAAVTSRALRSSLNKRTAGPFWLPLGHPLRGPEPGEYYKTLIADKGLHGAREAAAGAHGHSSDAGHGHGHGQSHAGAGGVALAPALSLHGGDKSTAHDNAGAASASALGAVAERVLADLAAADCAPSPADCDPAALLAVGCAGIPPLLPATALTATRLAKLRWMLDHTMGCGAVFEDRRDELARGYGARARQCLRLLIQNQSFRNGAGARVEAVDAEVRRQLAGRMEQFLLSLTAATAGARGGAHRPGASAVHTACGANAEPACGARAVTAPAPALCQSQLTVPTGAVPDAHVLLSFTRGTGAPWGFMRRYLRHAQPTAVVGDSIFTHGGLDADIIGFVPDPRAHADHRRLAPLYRMSGHAPAHAGTDCGETDASGRHICEAEDDEDDDAFVDHECKRGLRPHNPDKVISPTNPAAAPAPATTAHGAAAATAVPSAAPELATVASTGKPFNDRAPGVDLKLSRPVAEWSAAINVIARDAVAAWEAWPWYRSRGGARQARALVGVWRHDVDDDGHGEHAGHTRHGEGKAETTSIQHSVQHGVQRGAALPVRGAVQPRGCSGTSTSANAGVNPSSYGVNVLRDPYTTPYTANYALTQLNPALTVASPQPALIAQETESASHSSNVAHASASASAGAGGAQYPTVQSVLSLVPSPRRSAEALYVAALAATVSSSSGAYSASSAESDVVGSSRELGILYPATGPSALWDCPPSQAAAARNSAGQSALGNVTHASAAGAPPPMWLTQSLHANPSQALFEPGLPFSTDDDTASLGACNKSRATATVSAAMAATEDSEPSTAAARYYSILNNSNAKGSKNSSSSVASNVVSTASAFTSVLRSAAVTAAAASVADTVSVRGDKRVFSPLVVPLAPRDDPLSFAPLSSSPAFPYMYAPPSAAAVAASHAYSHGHAAHGHRATPAQSADAATRALSPYLMLPAAGDVGGAALDAAGLRADPAWWPLPHPRVSLPPLVAQLPPRLRAAAVTGELALWDIASPYTTAADAAAATAAPLGQGQSEHMDGSVRATATVTTTSPASESACDTASHREQGPYPTSLAVAVRASNRYRVRAGNTLMGYGYRPAAGGRTVIVRNHFNNSSNPVWKDAATVTIARAGGARNGGNGSRAARSCGATGSTTLLPSVYTGRSGDAAGSGAGAVRPVRAGVGLVRVLSGHVPWGDSPALMRHTLRIAPSQAGKGGDADASGGAAVVSAGAAAASLFEVVISDSSYSSGRCTRRLSPALAAEAAALISQQQQQQQQQQGVASVGSTGSIKTAGSASHVYATDFPVRRHAWEAKNKNRARLAPPAAAITHSGGGAAPGVSAVCDEAGTAVVTVPTPAARIAVAEVLIRGGTVFATLPALHNSSNINTDGAAKTAVAGPVAALEFTVTTVHGVLADGSPYSYLLAPSLLAEAPAAVRSAADTFARVLALSNNANDSNSDNSDMNANVRASASSEPLECFDRLFASALPAGTRVADALRLRRDYLLAARADLANALGCDGLVGLCVGADANAATAAAAAESAVDPKAAAAAAAEAAAAGVAAAAAVPGLPAGFTLEPVPGREGLAGYWVKAKVPLARLAAGSASGSAGAAGAASAGVDTGLPRWDGDFAARLHVALASDAALAQLAAAPGDNAAAAAAAAVPGAELFRSAFEAGPCAYVLARAHGHVLDYVYLRRDELAQRVRSWDTPEGVDDVECDGGVRLLQAMF